MSAEDGDRVERETEVMEILIAQARRQLNDIERQKREARRQYSRDYYAKNREKHLEDQRRYRAAQREADPDRYRAQKRERNQRWREKHKGEVNAKLREKYRANKEVHQEKRAKFYAENAETEKARRRAYYAANKERANASHRNWYQREKRRVKAGLPAVRVHRTPRDEHRSNLAAADAFFARVRTADELTAIRKEEETPADVWAAWMRECLKARAAHNLSVQHEELARLQKELGARRIRPKVPTLLELEDARLDAIAREVNERLRRREPSRRAHHLDPAAPHPLLQQQHNTTGMNR